MRYKEIPFEDQRRNHPAGTARGMCIACTLACGLLAARTSDAQTTVSWTGGSGLWSDPAHWVGGVVPNNAGALTYIADIDVAGDITITVVDSVTLSGLILAESVQVDPGGELILIGEVSNQGRLVAAGGSVMVGAVPWTGTGGLLEADGGVVTIDGATITGGALRVTDDPASFLRFRGTVTMTNVPWEDAGAGEFQMYNTTAEFLGDYAHNLPAGYTLVVRSFGTHAPVQWTLAGGVFTNNGVIELRDGGGGYVGYPRLYWQGSATLTGDGEVWLSGAGSETLMTAPADTVLTVDASQRVHGRGDLQLHVVNRGTLEPDIPNRRIRVGGALTNHGTVRCENQGQMLVTGGLTNETSATVGVESGGSLTVNGAVRTATDLTAGAGGTILFDTTSITLQGNKLVADGGTLTLTDTSVENGALRVTDDPASLLRFSGAIAMTTVPWEDPGAGEFQIHKTTTEFLGDYARILPAGYTLVVDAQSTHAPVQWTMAGGVFTNNGLIELRHAGGGWVGYPRLHWTSSGTLSGNGAVSLNGAAGDALFAGEAGAALTVAAPQRVAGCGDLQLDVLNQGTLESNLPAKRIRVGGLLTNQGVVSCSGGGNLVLAGGLANETGGTVDVRDGGNLTLNGTVSTVTDLSAGPTSTMRVDGATVSLLGNRLVADGSIVTIADSSITEGTLRVANDPVGFVRFSGMVTLNNVAWEDPGLGEFQIRNTTTQFLGDYANGLPAGYTLVVYSQQTHQPVRWTLAGGVFSNDGMIELRDSGGGWIGYPRLHWQNSGTLNGAGEVYLSSTGTDAQVTGEHGVIVTIGSDQWFHGRGDMQVGVINQGILEADLAGQRLRFTSLLRNEGYLAVLPGATLRAERDLHNEGTIVADGGILDINGSLIMGPAATLDTQNGAALQLQRHFWSETSNPGATTAPLALLLDGNGAAAPDLSAQAFFVEAEDFNFDRGKHAAAADIMPYTGGAFASEGGRDRIDYHQTENVVASDLYRVAEGPGLNVNIKPWPEMYRGTFLATVNYAVTHNDAGEWYNYGRTYPAPAVDRYLFARLAAGSAAHGIQIDEVTGSVNTPSQTLARMGEIRGPASGSWDRYTYLPVRDDSGALVPFAWSGDHTFRATILPGSAQDIDLFVFAPAATSGPDQLVEVMSRDLGASTAGLVANYALESLTLSADSRARLIDWSDNAPGAGAEAVYVESLIVPVGATLDLNGLQLYAQNAQVEGAIVGGTIQPILEGAPRLHLRRLGAHTEISWPDSWPGFALESTDSLVPPASWTPVVIPPDVVLDRKVVTDLLTDPRRVYRLHRE